MKSIDPDAKWVQALMGAASYGARGYQGAQAAKAYLLQNPMLALAIGLVLVAILLRLTGVM